MSNLTKANVYIKREDLQLNKSFKCRGAINSVNQQVRRNKNIDKLICASTGNHAQGIALACSRFKIKGTIFMPLGVSRIKYDSALKFGINDKTQYVEIVLVGDNFDEALNQALEYQKAHSNSVFIHPYDDLDTINGQSTIMQEINEDLPCCDYVFLPVGGGGLLGGIIKIVKSLKLKTKVVACQSELCFPLHDSIIHQEQITHDIKNLERITEGSIVKKIGDIPWDIIKNFDNIEVDILKNQEVLYAIGMLKTEMEIESEGAGALSLACFLKYFKSCDLNGKNIVLINSGGNISSGTLKSGVSVYSDGLF